jgi:hypothetical protein
VGDHDDGLGVPVHRGPQQVEDLAAGAGVQRAGRLVGEQHSGPGDQGTGDGHPLLLPAGQLARPVPGAVREAHLGERRGHLAGRRPAPGQAQRQGHVLRRGQRRDQVERLEDEADPGPAELGQGAFGEAAQRYAVDHHLAAGGPVQPRRAVQQRRLPGAGGAHHRGEGGGRDPHVHPGQGGHRALPRAVRPDHGPQFDRQSCTRDRHAVQRTVPGRRKQSCGRETRG